MAFVNGSSVKVGQLPQYPCFMGCKRYIYIYIFIFVFSTYFFDRPYNVSVFFLLSHKSSCIPKNNNIKFFLNGCPNQILLLFIIHILTYQSFVKFLVKIFVPYILIEKHNNNFCFSNWYQYFQ